MWEGRSDILRVHVIAEEKKKIKLQRHQASSFPSLPCPSFWSPKQALPGLSGTDKSSRATRSLIQKGTEGDIPFFHGDRVHEKAVGNSYSVSDDTG